MKSLSVIAFALMAACVMATQADIDYIDAVVNHNDNSF